MRQIREAIALGGLVSGDKLPSHREMAEQLVVTPLTVKKPYDKMEAADTWRRSADGERS